MLSSLDYTIPQDILTRAQALPPLQVIVCGAQTEHVLNTVRQAVELGLIKPVLVGDEKKIKDVAAQDMQWDISDLRIIPATTEAQIGALAARALSQGEGEVLLKGDIHTDVMLRAVLDKSLNLRGKRRMSHVFYMTVPYSDQRLFITDGAMNVCPDEKILIDIIENAIDFAYSLEAKKPKVACLSGTETPIEGMPSSLLMRRMAQVFAEHPHAEAVEGPLAFDNAISRQAADIKRISGRVPGEPDILVVPNLEAGNILFKSMVYFMSANSAGLVLGAKKPIVLSARSDPPEAKITALALASLYTAQKKSSQP